MTMATLVLGVSALACPLVMVGMMWAMRGSARKKDADER